MLKRPNRNFNGLIMIQPPARRQVFAATSLKAAPGRTNYAETINLSSQITRPEDQGNYGTCVAWSTTTFIESLMWKLTGEKEEFTVDEIYNLYLDAYGYDPSTVGTDPLTDSYTPIPAERRKGYYNNGDWGLIPNDIAQRGLYHFNANIGVFENYNTIIDCIMPSRYNYAFVYYWIVHYNDPDVRKNHYPDRFSPLCEKVKNYIFKNHGDISSMCADEYMANEYRYVLNPLNIKNRLNKFGTPVCAGLMGYSGGHQVVCAVQEPGAFKFDSSWDSNDIYYITLTYNQATPGYYTGTSYEGLSTCTGMDYYQELPDGNKLTILSTDNGQVYGAEDKDRFLSSVTLLAVPDSGKYFNKWTCSKNGAATQEYLVNPCTFNMSCDISVKAVFSNQPNLNTAYTLTIRQPDTGTVAGASDGQTFTYGQTATLTVTSETNNFVSWNDGNTDNPRTFTMTENKFAFPIMSKWGGEQIDLATADLRVECYWMYWPLVNVSSDWLPTPAVSCDGVELIYGEDYVYTVTLDDDPSKEQYNTKGIFDISGINHFKGTITNICSVGTVRRYYQVVINFSENMINSVNYLETDMVSMTNIEEFYDNEQRDTTVMNGEPAKISLANPMISWNYSLASGQQHQLTFTPKTGYTFQGWYYVPINKNCRNISDAVFITANPTLDINAYTSNIPYCEKDLPYMVMGAHLLLCAKVTIDTSIVTPPSSTGTSGFKNFMQPKTAQSTEN